MKKKKIIKSEKSDDNVQIKGVFQLRPRQPPLRQKESRRLPPEQSPTHVQYQFPPEAAQLKIFGKKVFNLTYFGQNLAKSRPTTIGPRWPRRHTTVLHLPMASILSK